MPTELVLYDAARTALQKAVRCDEVKSIRDKAEAMRAYGKQAGDRQMEADAFEIRERATRRLGVLIADQKALPREQGGGLAKGAATAGTKREAPRGKLRGSETDPRSIPTLADLGIDKHLADEARKLAKMPPAQFEKHAKAHVGHATGESEWYTPKEYIAAATSVMGGIDLDPASCTAANKVVRATRFFAAEDDGLTKNWPGRVWMNPPYSQPLLSRFAAKLILEIESDHVSSAIKIGRA